MTESLRCDVCGTLTVNTCPVCEDMPLCLKCAGEFGGCGECFDDDDDDDDDEPERDDEATSRDTSWY